MIYRMAIAFLILSQTRILSAQYITEDAERFANILNEYPDGVSKRVIKKDYLRLGTRGIKIFTPNRIKNARNLTTIVNKNREWYDKGVKLMLPVALSAAPEAEQVLSRTQEFLNQEESAPVYIVFGANNSGGTASDDGLVIGLEVLSRFVETEPEAKKLIKSFVAHEIIHVYQQRVGNGGSRNLLVQSLREGFADFMENMVMDGISNAEKDRHDYGLLHESQLWSEFQIDMHGEEFRPWMYGDGKEGRPSDLGYWIGKRICEAYYNQAQDKQQALQDLLRLKDAELILKQSGYNPTG